MEKITLIKTEDNTIWVTSDEDANGIESKIDRCYDDGQSMLIALAEFLGYEPLELLNFDEEEE